MALANRTAGLLAGLVFGWGVLNSAVAWGDTISLRGGGQVEGKVEADPQHKDRVRIWMLRGRNPMVVERSRIVGIVEKATPLDAYFKKVKAVSATAQAEYDLGLWCEKNGLKDLAPVRYEAAIKLDHQFEPAHKKLGHVFHDGYWLSRDELSRAQGLVKYKGKWISAEEREKRDLEVEALSVQATWVRRVSLLRQAYLNGTVDRQREAEGQLMSIREPKAVGALVRVFGNQERQERILLAHVLERIPGVEATRALVGRIVLEPEPDVRSIMFDKLKARKDPEAVISLVRALGRSDVSAINRAAWALGELGAMDAVPRLVSVLVTSESRIVVASAENVQAPLNFTASANLPLVPIGVNQSSAAFMIPPAVGPGAVAYGGFSVPNYWLMQGTGLNVAPESRPDARVATFVYQNSEVRSALAKLTGKDFGFDVATWREWLRRTFKQRAAPARKLPQP